MSNWKLWLSFATAMAVVAARHAEGAREILQEGGTFGFPGSQPAEGSTPDQSGEGQDQTQFEGGDSQPAPPPPPSGGGGGGAAGCIKINEVLHKPKENNGVKGEDYVELINLCDEAIDMAGYTLFDEDDNAFTMGQDGCSHLIGAKDRLVLFRRNECSFEFGYTGADKAVLQDASGNIVDSVEWTKENADEGKSWSRIPDGTGEFQDGQPTPGAENTPA